MITIRIDCKTGKSSIIESYPSPKDVTTEQLAALIVDWAIESGTIDKVLKNIDNDIQPQ